MSKPKEKILRRWSPASERENLVFKNWISLFKTYQNLLSHHFFSKHDIWQLIIKLDNHTFSNSSINKQTLSLPNILPNSSPLIQTSSIDKRSQTVFIADYFLETQKRCKNKSTNYSMKNWQIRPLTDCPKIPNDDSNPLAVPCSDCPMSIDEEKCHDLGWEPIFSLWTKKTPTTAESSKPKSINPSLPALTRLETNTSKQSVLVFLKWRW